MFLHIVKIDESEWLIHDGGKLAFNRLSHGRAAIVLDGVAHELAVGFETLISVLDGRQLYLDMRE